jgi:hypothetical protein
MGDRPGVSYDLLDGDTVYAVWAVYNNEESVVVMRVRKDAGLPSDAGTKFFGSLQFGIDKPPEKKGNSPGAGSPGVPGLPGGRPGAGAPAPPPPPPPPPK